MSPRHSRSSAGRRRRRGTLGHAVVIILGILGVLVVAAALVRADPPPQGPPAQPGSPAAPAQQSYDFKRRAVEGERWSIEQKTDVKQESTASAEGMPAQQAAQSSRAVRKLALTVLAVQDGVPTSMRLEFDPSCAVNVEAMGWREETKFPLAGKVVTLTREPGGVVKHDQGLLDLAIQAELTAYMEETNPYRPPYAVKVGEEWDGDTTAVARQLQIGHGDSVSLKCRLESAKEVGGRAAGVVRWTQEISKSAVGLGHMRTRTEGVTWIDVKTGQLLQVDFKGETSSSGEQMTRTPDGRAVKVAMSGKGASEYHARATALGAQVAGGTDGGATAGGAAPAPAVPAIPPAPPGAEPQRQPTPAPFAGTFSDAKLTVELKPTEAGKYAGTVTLGDRQFPLTAAETGRGLEGTFQSQGVAFVFAAAVAGNTLTFTTGKSTYSLTRAGANPLDQGANTPHNPLEQPVPPPSKEQPPKNEPPKEVPPPADEEHPPALIGTWSGQMKASQVIVACTLVLRADGHYVLRTQLGGVQEGNWTATADSLTQMPDDGPAERHPYQLKGDRLTITASASVLKLARVNGE